MHACTAHGDAPPAVTVSPLASQLLQMSGSSADRPSPSPAPPARARAASQSQWYHHEISGTMITIALSNGAGGSCDRGPPGRPLFAHVQHRASAVRRAPASEPPEAAPLIALEASDRGRKPEAQSIVQSTVVKAHPARQRIKAHPPPESVPTTLSRRMWCTEGHVTTVNAHSEVAGHHLEDQTRNEE